MTKLGAAVLKGHALESAKVICVLTHGRGQSPEAMEEHVLRRLVAREVAFVLPRAATGSWYAARAVDPMTEETQDQLDESLSGLRGTVEALPDVPLVMAGFSQGACLSIEYAMRFGRWDGALVAFTGCRVGAMGDDRPSRDLTGLSAYVSGSDADPWIPVLGFSEAVRELGAARARVRADIFPNRAHEVSDTEIAVLEHTLAHLGSKAAPW
jgi:phospholipase/carboxylesterase